MEPSETREIAALTPDDLAAIAATATAVRPRELHVRDRETLLRLTGADIEANPARGVHLTTSLPVYYDETLLPDQMDMRDERTGQLLRRWILRPNGEVLSVDVSRLGELFDL